jgi:vesicle coat complex subunit
MLPKVTSEAKKNISTALAPRSVTAKLNPVKLAELLSSKYNEELIQALGMLIGVFLQNRDMEVYMSRVINLLPRDDFELKRLC